MTTLADAKSRAMALQLHGLLAHWSECADAPWLDAVLSWGKPSAAGVRWSGGCAVRISVVSSRWPISTGRGHSSATSAPSQN